MSYMAFGEGPRKCIGQRFALLEAKLALFFLLRSFKLSLAPKTSHPIKYRNKGISLAPENDAVWIIPEARNWIKKEAFFIVSSRYFLLVLEKETTWFWLTDNLAVFAYLDILLHDACCYMHL